MRLISKILLAGIFAFQLNAANDEININFKDLKVMDLVKITSKIVNKNILITEEIKVMLILFQINQLIKMN